VHVVRTDSSDVIGRLVETSENEGGDAALETDKGVVRIAYADVRRATVEVEFAGSSGSAGSSP